jgi:hypothetical protein
MAISPYTKRENYDTFLRYSMDSTVALAGSGCSVIPGIPIWKGFVEKLKEEVNVDLPDATALLEIGKVLEAASLIYNALPDPADFYTGIADLITRSQQARFHDLHMAIWQDFKKVITTNYDHCLEEAFESQNRIISKFGGRVPTISSQQIPTLDFDAFHSAEWAIAYIHGRAGSQNLVLRAEDYQKFYPSRHSGISPDPSNNLEVFLKSMVENYSFVFIGFSLDDEDFVKTFERIRAEYVDRHKGDPEALLRFAERKHFIFLRNDELKDWVNMDDIYKAGLSQDKIYKILDNYDRIDNERKIFRRNFQNSFDRLGFATDERKKVIALSEKIVDNQKKLKLLNDLNILDIRIPGSDYKAISEFLASIKVTEASADTISVDSI